MRYIVDCRRRKGRDQDMGRSLLFFSDGVGLLFVLELLPVLHYVAVCDHVILLRLRSIIIIMMIPHLDRTLRIESIGF